MSAYGPGARARAAGEHCLEESQSSSSGVVAVGGPGFRTGAWRRQERHARRQAQRKAQQFCRQVQRALNLALADRYEDDGLNELFVDEVTPAPDCGHLLVHVVVPDNRSMADALSSLRQDAPRLRSEVAMTISRKRAPELSFVPYDAERR